MTQGGFPHSSERIRLFASMIPGDSSCLGMLLGSVGFVMLLFYVVQLGATDVRQIATNPASTAEHSWTACASNGIVGNILLRFSTAVLSCTAFFVYIFYSLILHLVWVSWTAGNWRGLKEINLPRHQVRTCRICVCGIVG